MTIRPLRLDRAILCFVSADPSEAKSSSPWNGILFLGIPKLTVSNNKLRLPETGPKQSMSDQFRKINNSVIFSYQHDETKVLCTSTRGSARLNEQRDVCIGDSERLHRAGPRHVSVFP